jgi:hypothetical protein
MRRRTAIIGVAALAGVIGIVACAPMQVRTYVPHASDVRKYHTYGWAPAGAFQTGDPRLDNNTIFIAQLQSAVERQMARKGWASAPANQADLVIHFHARVDQRLDLNDVPSGQVNEDSGGGPLVYDAGTLLLDFIEPRSSTLVWRGWAEGSVENVIDNQASMNAKIDAAVERILETFPSMAVPSAAAGGKP